MYLLFLNDVGTGEFLLIVAVVLMLFGSKGVPDIVKNLGKGIREIKSASDEIKRDIQNSALEMRRDMNLPSVDELAKMDEIKSLEKDINTAIKAPDLSVPTENPKKTTETKEEDQTKAGV
ncbi:MAG: twin-arginine translocase TatA/TatE family subunit [Crocinitomicaceae bacterium]|nr:twin-arginine translocase TatA/TatE family subunit [Crocinitomicaceae bacterium]MBK8925935.1 twin-arginine translocase TatA/TatE family subunit [Crocinitomicaceae bacterium]